MLLPILVYELVKIHIFIDKLIGYISLFPYTNGTYLRGEARPQARDLGDMSYSCMETAIYCLDSHNNFLTIL